MATLFLDRLHCNTTEDNIGGDHAYIKVDGEQVWGPFRINNGESLDIGKQVNFNGQVAIELWDEDDLDPDDLLGRHVVGPGAGGTLKFDNDEADYDLHYRVG